MSVFCIRHMWWIEKNMYEPLVLYVPGGKGVEGARPLLSGFFVRILSFLKKKIRILSCPNFHIPDFVALILSLLISALLFTVDLPLAGSKPIILINAHSSHTFDFSLCKIYRERESSCHTMLEHKWVDIASILLCGVIVVRAEMTAYTP